MKVAIFAVAAISVSSIVEAQSFSTHGPHGTGSGPVTVRRAGESTVDRLARQLDLNEGQKAQVQAILDEQRAKLDEYLQEQRAAGRDPAIEQIRSMKQQVEEEALGEVRALLTDSQVSKLALLVQEQGGELLGSPAGMALSVDPSGALCDSSGKCISR